MDYVWTLQPLNVVRIYAALWFITPPVEIIKTQRQHGKKSPKHLTAKKFSLDSNKCWYKNRATLEPSGCDKTLISDELSMTAGWKGGGDMNEESLYSLFSWQSKAIFPSNVVFADWKINVLNYINLAKKTPTQTHEKKLWQARVFCPQWSSWITDVKKAACVYSSALSTEWKIRLSFWRFSETKKKKVWKSVTIRSSVISKKAFHRWEKVRHLRVKKKESQAWRRRSFSPGSKHKLQLWLRSLFDCQTEYCTESHKSLSFTHTYGRCVILNGNKNVVRVIKMGLPSSQ